jgi:hypothetical protein
MKRIFFVFSLLALVFTGYSTLQAQNAAALASPARSGMTQLEAYKVNFTAAVNQGNIQMADPHRIKLTSYMEREIAAADILASKPSAPRDAKKNVTRQNEILTTFRTMDLSTAAALDAAKAKLPLIDEFGTLMPKTPATN